MRFLRNQTMKREGVGMMNTETKPVAEVRADTMIWVAAGLSLFAGVVHWAVSPGYLAYWWGYGFFFIIAGICQIAYALGIFAMQAFAPPAGEAERSSEPPRHAIYLLGALGKAAIVALYIVTRTIGVPFVGPAEDVVLPLTPESVAVTLAEIVLIVILFSLARRRTRPI